MILALGIKFEDITKTIIDVIRRMFVDYDTSICSMRMITEPWSTKCDNQRDYNTEQRQQYGIWYLLYRDCNNNNILIYLVTQRSFK